MTPEMHSSSLDEEKKVHNNIMFILNVYFFLSSYNMNV